MRMGIQTRTFWRVSLHSITVIVYLFIFIRYVLRVCARAQCTNKPSGASMNFRSTDRKTPEHAGIKAAEHIEKLQTTRVYIQVYVYKGKKQTDAVGAVGENH